MGNLAAMLKQSGHNITGSDNVLYPPMSTQLDKWGIRVSSFSGKKIKNADLFIIGNAISRGNPEAEYILNHRLNYMSMPGAISEFFLKEKKVIVIAGTHGKTTTAFLMDHVLSKTIGPPGFFAGGIRGDGMSGYRLSESPYFVIEGDEYDSAFFDKSSKFLHYRPYYLILTSVEFDHADIFENFKEYKRSFERLLRTVPSRGLVVACSENRGVKSVLKNYTFSPVKYYSFEFIRKFINRIFGRYAPDREA